MPEPPAPCVLAIVEDGRPTHPGRLGGRGFVGRAELGRWLYRIAVSTALNTLRGGKRGAALAQRSSAEAAHVGGRPEALGTGGGDPAQKSQHSAEVVRVLGAIAELSP